MSLPCGATGMSAVYIVVFPDHTHLLFLNQILNVLKYVNPYNALETDSADIIGLLLDTCSLK